MEGVNFTDEYEYTYINTYDPLPWQVAPWRDKSKVMLLSGSAGGGKSRLASEKVHGFCLRYPGSTGLVLRKVRATMSNSTLLFLKRRVIGQDPRVRHLANSFRFEYSNGSILAYGGMKDDEQREHIRSIGQDGGVDICWMEEATQFTEKDFDEVLARMRGKAADWTQVLLTTNPDSPNHWIRQRLILGQDASIYNSSALDNPHLPDDYHDILRSLRGVQYQRLVLGEWVEGSGRVIDTWVDSFNRVTGVERPGGNVTLDAEYIPDGGPLVWAIDDGYAGKQDRKTRLFSANSHPRAILLCQMRGNGQIAVFYESYEVEMLAADHIQQVLGVCEAKGWPRPAYVVRDRAAASLDGALHQFYIRSRFNAQLVDEGVKELREWCGEDKNGFRRIIAHPRCFYFCNEMMSYAMDEDNRIIKAHDHGIDAIRYLVWDTAYGYSMVVDVAVPSDFSDYRDPPQDFWGVDVATVGDVVGMMK